MSDELTKLLLIDCDRIFRMGMRSWLAQFPDLQVVAEAETTTEALRILQGDVEFNLVILDVNWTNQNFAIAENSRTGLELCQRLRTEYPQLRILVLSASQSPEQLDMLLQMGVNGYCFKGTNPEQLLTAIRTVAAGNRYVSDRNLLSVSSAPQTQAPMSVVEIIRRNFYVSGLQRIDDAFHQVQATLTSSRDQQIQDRLAKMVLAGQARELQAARWLVDRLWGQKTPPLISSNIQEDVSPNVEQLRSQNQPEDQPHRNVLAVQASLWDKTVAKLQSSLVNLHKYPLEIDALKDDKKRELLYIALRQIEQSITELRFSQITPLQLESKITEILRGIWQETIINFFGKYSVIANLDEPDAEINVVDVLLADVEIIQREFLDKIPQIDNLLSHLLFETELIISNSSAAVGTLEAMQRSEMILDNLVIQIANATIQPLLNNFANVEEIKQKFYRYNLLSTREIERFRNDLSWKYRLEKYIGEPQLIFESRHLLSILTERGIKRVSIYVPRNQELQQLEGVQLAVTLALELQDAIAPRLKSAIAFIGSGFVYILTNVIGRGIGLIGRGVVQGIGNAWQDRNK
ncbi:DUF3685 domain-containing protein [Pseudanabaena mucicola]|uniref:DUF3685 domain-containing protein n=1 Tax=Pseudanabaena mucicola FACHB-723 TaxID=2692860 RepID=A0ABR8A0V7_9CYAN|nr:DUF3685 domain-containing protein [Pseudanabaena mucicola]MBD2189857.1 DUF3685 domain-containing protein [Pseudanabaena mucicola FACHB-723]